MRNLLHRLRVRFLAGIEQFKKNWELECIEEESRKSREICKAERKKRKQTERARQFKLERQIPLQKHQEAREQQVVLGGTPSPLSTHKFHQPKTSHLGAKTGKSRIYDTIRFKYRGTEGALTERTVDITSGKKGHIFGGFCHLRKEERSFYFDRIIDYAVIDTTTGEVMTPMTWRYRLQGTKVAKEAMEEEREMLRRRKEKLPE